MARHLQHEVENLKRKMLRLGGVVEQSFQRAVRAIQERDAEAARAVVNRDVEIDRMEVDLEEECLKVLALHQPVAVDLRFIIAILKINNDLERIGDLAVNLAERAAFLSELPAVPMPFDFAGMAEKTRAMLKNALDALVFRDSGMARAVCAADDEVDAVNRTMYRKVVEGIRKHPEQVEGLITMFSISRQIERIADHATNIAEDVVYTLEGDIIRHAHSIGKREPPAPGE